MHLPLNTGIRESQVKLTPNKKDSFITKMVKGGNFLKYSNNLRRDDTFQKFVYPNKPSQ